MSDFVIRKDKHPGRMAIRVCSGCGEKREIRAGRLKSNMLCQKCSMSKLFKTHGMRKSRTYSIWLNMRTRCYNPKATNYSRYGAKGIKVCDRWQASFENFLEDMGECPKGLTIERGDSEGNYELSNCSWETYLTQNRNRSNTIKLTYQGKTLTASEWAYLINCPYNRFIKRYKSGWPMEKILFTPLRRSHANT